MKKSVYSLVLMDDIVAAIDELAYSLHTSRSNLINQILAEKVALVTPKQQLQDIFNQLSECLSSHQHFQIQNQAADHMYSIKSILRYKYNPTIRYSIYLNEKYNALGGELRIISRTQSEVLHNYLNHFFKMWSAIENQKREIVWQREEGAKWLRVLRVEDFQTVRAHNDLANALSDYIRLLDQGLKIYFRQIERGYEDVEELVNYYHRYEIEGCIMV